jgi:hypothetical protein
MRTEAQYKKLLQESDRLCMNWDEISLNDLKHLPMLGSGEEAPPYHDLLLSEILAENNDNGTWLADSLAEANKADHVKRRAFMIHSNIGGYDDACWGNELEAMLCVFENGTWFNLLMRWQLEVVRRLAKIQTLTLAGLARIQNELGSDVWPRGHRLPTVDTSLMLWQKQLLSDGYPGFLISSAWPMADTSGDPKLFEIQGGDVVKEWFSFS